MTGIQRYVSVRSASQGGYSAFILPSPAQYQGTERSLEASATKQTIGDIGDYEMVDIYTITTPDGIASYTTPSPIPSGFGGGGQVQSYGSGYIAYAETGELAYIYAIRIQQAYGTGAGRSKFFKHIISLGAAIAEFQSIVEEGWSTNFPPDGQEFVGGVGLDAYTLAVDNSLIFSSPRFYNQFS